MKVWLLIIAGMLVSWLLTDVDSGSDFSGLLAPSLFILLLLAAVVKLMLRISGSRSSDGSMGEGFTVDIDSSGGGDCGGD